MIHAFDTDIAQQYGLLESILLNHIWYWVTKNRANEVNHFDGKYWTYNSVRAFSVLFPYATPKQIRTALEHLRREGILETGNYNESAYNHTLWYTVTKKGESALRQKQVDSPRKASQRDLAGKTFISSVDNTIDNTNKNKDAKRPPRPTLEEVKSYCKERGNQVDPERFLDYYTSNGWKVGRNPMKDWRAAVRTWERRDKAPPAVDNVLKIS